MSGRASLGIAALLVAVVLLAARARRSFDATLAEDAPDAAERVKTRGPSLVVPRLASSGARRTGLSAPSSSGAISGPRRAVSGSGEAIGELLLNEEPMRCNGLLVLRDVKTREDVDVIVRDGRCLVPLSAQAEFDVVSLRSDGQVCAVASEKIALAPGSQFRLAVLPPTRHEIRAVYAENGARAYDALAIRIADPSGSPFDRVGIRWPSVISTTTVRSGGDGVISLPSDWGGTLWFVGAPGRAYASVLTSRGQTDKTVLLPRSGTLRLEVAQFAKLPSVEVEAISEAWGYVYTPGLGADGTLTVPGLPAGEWRLSVTDAVRSETVYGEQRVTVVDGAVSAVQIEPRLDRVPARVSVEFRVELAPGWGLEDGVLSLIPDQGARRRQATVDLRFDAAGVATTRLDLPADLYVATVAEAGFCDEIRITASGAHTIRIAGPVDLEVRLADSESGALVRDGSVSAAASTICKDGLTHRLRVPAGPVGLSIDAPGFCPGQWVRVVALSPVTEVVVPIVATGRMVVHSDFEAGASVTAEGSSGLAEDRGCVCELSSGEGRVDDLQPGRWHVTLADRDGEVLSEQDVEIRPHREARVVFRPTR